MSIHQLKNKNHLFVLPDGSPLRYAPHWKRGLQSEWFMSWDDPRVWEASRNEKSKQHRINLWPTKTKFSLVAADFDKVPDGFHSFDALYEYLRMIFTKEEAVATRSASTRVKIFFLVETTGVAMNTPIALDTLERIFQFDSTLYEALDKKHSSLSISYLNECLLEDLYRGIPYLKPIPAVLPEGGEGAVNTSTTTNSHLAKLRFYEGCVADVLPAAKFRGARDRFLRILLRSLELLSPYGFGISTRKIAKQLNVSQQLIWRYRKKFERDGWLVASSRHFKPGIKAIRFTAGGPLALALKQIHPPSTFKLELPKSIPDGQWNQTLGALIKLLSLCLTLEEVIDLIRGIEGSQKGDRMKQARNWYHWWKKKRASYSTSGVCAKKVVAS